jgi:hypothetical protein
LEKVIILWRVRVGRTSTSGFVVFNWLTLINLSAVFFGGFNWRATPINSIGADPVIRIAVALTFIEGALCSTTLNSLGVIAGFLAV